MTAQITIILFVLGNCSSDQFQQTQQWPSQSTSLGINGNSSLPSNLSATAGPDLKHVDKQDKQDQVTFETFPAGELMPKTLSTYSGLQNGFNFSIASIAPIVAVYESQSNTSSPSGYSLTRQLLSAAQLEEKDEDEGPSASIASQQRTHLEEYRPFAWEKRVRGRGVLFAGSQDEEGAEAAAGQMQANRGQIGHKSRELLDVYADSLRFVNRLYNQVYGTTATRKVPAHMAHMVDRDIVDRFQLAFAAEVDATSSHPMRTSHDMQFAFSYFYFLASETVPQNVTEILEQFDLDHSG